MDILTDIVRLSLLKVLWIGSVLGLLVGAGLLFRPQLVIRMNQYCSRWVGSNRLTQLLDRPRWTERFFYRHHRIVGAGLLLGALAALYTFLFSHNFRKIFPFVPSSYLWLADALMGMLIIGSVFATLIGIIVLTRPSLLRNIEASANHWVSTDLMLKWFNGMNYSFEESILQHRKLTGACLIIGSSYILIAFPYFSFLSTGRF